MKRAVIAIAAAPALPVSAIAQDCSRFSDEGLARELVERADAEGALVAMRDGVGSIGAGPGGDLYL